MVEIGLVPSGSTPSAVVVSSKRSDAQEFPTGGGAQPRVCQRSSVDGRQQKKSYVFNGADREMRTAETGRNGQGGGEEREGGGGGDERESETGRRKESVAGGRVTNDVAFVLRKLYTGGGLDAQQQGWDRMPTDLFNTLTLQLGTLSKVCDCRGTAFSFLFHVLRPG